MNRAQSALKGCAILLAGTLAGAALRPGSVRAERSDAAPQPVEPYIIGGNGQPSAISRGNPLPVRVVQPATLAVGRIYEVRFQNSLRLPAPTQANSAAAEVTESTLLIRPLAPIDSNGWLRAEYGTAVAGDGLNFGPQFAGLFNMSSAVFAIPKN